VATLREIRRRIGGVKSTQKITKAMKMVAAARLRRAQDAVIAARPYARSMRKLLRHIATRIDVSTDPYFTARQVRQVAIVVVTADRGLCGAFNANIIRAAVTHIRTNYPELHREDRVHLICVGRKGTDFFQKNNYPIDAKHVGIFGSLSIANAREIVAQMKEGFLGGRYDRVEIVYNEFKSIMHQRIVIEQILPIPPEEVLGNSAGKKLASYVNYIYEPSIEAILSALVPRHLNFQMYHILLESNAAEQGARMTAMDNATTNASDLIHALQLSYNKARQASITKELLEIVSGAEALKQAD
jgi:F-type H+-transporting ATPase subunit gamma